MATFSLVHGAWGGGWLWDPLRAELETRGHVVHAPDLPCEDVDTGVEEYAAAVPPADVVVGYSLGGLTIPFVEAHTHVFLAALVAGAVGDWEDVFVPGFGDARVRDELGRSYYPRPRRRGSGVADPSRARAPRREAASPGTVRRPGGSRRPAGIHRVHAGRRHPSRLAAPRRARGLRRGAARARRRPLADARVPA